ncbi:hypothetical protein [Schlesneria paludicola]|uniref:hypothetical protein n=1 Tax=Schlesneria paludicola TaxID=360056 RepID=UPI0002F092F1|nr:hypothetical protein [Schlesneria paludicola]
MSLMIGGASLLLGMLIIVAILQQRALHHDSSVAQAESTAPAVDTTQLDVTSPMTQSQPSDEDQQPLADLSPSDTDSPVNESPSPEATTKAHTDTALAEVASTSASVPEEPMPEEEPDEVTPESTNPTAEDFEKRIVKAAQLIRDQKGKEAIITLKQASGAYPKEIRADFYLGLIYSGIGLNEPKNAEIHLKRVLEREANHIPTLNNLGLVAINARKYPAARNYFSQALKSDPRPKEVEQNLGRMLNRAKILEIKNDQLKTIIALKPNEDAYQQGVGWLYMPLDRTEKSLQEYKSFSKTSELEDRSCCYCQGKQTVTCRTCAGKKTAVRSDAVGQTRNLGLGNQSTVTPVHTLVACPTCSGRGRVDCQACFTGQDPDVAQRRN